MQLEFRFPKISAPERQKTPVRGQFNQDPKILLTRIPKDFRRKWLSGTRRWWSSRRRHGYVWNQDGEESSCCGGEVVGYGGADAKDQDPDFLKMQILHRKNVK